MADMASKERQGGRKLTATQVLEIRDKYKPRVCTKAMLAAEYGVSKSTIEKIVYNTWWRHIS